MKLFSRNQDLKIIEQINSKSSVKRHIQFIIGCLLIALSYNLFLAPNDIVAGGVGGLAIIINHLTGLDNSMIILIGSILLLIVSYFLLGKEKTKASILGSLLFPIFVNMTSYITARISIDNSELLLVSVFGGVVYGFGAGMIYKAGFTTGGTDIVNQILAKYFKISIGKGMLYCDGTIVLLTAFHAKGGYLKERETVLMCVLPTKDYYRLKEVIHEIDPNAFFVVTDAYEVFGGE